jgi:transcription initiation factor IIE alpha subunit
MKKSKPKSNFLPMPHALIEEYIKPLGNSAFVVFLILYQLAHRYGDRFYHTDQQISDRYGISLSMLRRARTKLKEHGFINYRSGSSSKARATIYTILPDSNLRVQFRIVGVPKKDNGGSQNE